MPRRRSSGAVRLRRRWPPRPSTRASRAATATAGGSGASECWGAGGADENWASASACAADEPPPDPPGAGASDRAEELSPGRIRFGHELIDLEQDEDGVTAVIRERDARTRVQRPRAVRDRRRRGPHDPGSGRHRLRGPRRPRPHRDDPCHGGLLSAGRRPGCASPLDPLAAGGDRRGDGADGTRALGHGLRGVGDPPQLPARRSRARSPTRRSRATFGPRSASAITRCRST